MSAKPTGRVVIFLKGGASSEEATPATGITSSGRRRCTCAYYEGTVAVLQCSRPIEPGTMFCVPCHLLKCYDRESDTYGGTHPHEGHEPSTPQEAS